MHIIPRPSTNWADAGTMTIEATTTNPTKGTVNFDKVMWRYDGQDAIIRFMYNQGAAGGAGSGDYLLKIPSVIGLVDTNILPAYTNNLSTQTNICQPSLCGYFSGGTAGSNNAHGNVFLYSSSQLRAVIDIVGAASGGVWGSSFFQFNVANIGFCFDIRVPIVGRSS